MYLLVSAAWWTFSMIIFIPTFVQVSVQIESFEEHVLETS